MMPIDYVLLFVLGAVFSIGAQLLNRVLKLVAWIPFVKLAITLVGGLAGAIVACIFITIFVAPNVPAVETSQVGSWIVVVGYFVIQFIPWLSDASPAR